MRRDQWNHSVPTEPKPVHPEGQPIRASTNSGLSLRPEAEVVSPSVPVVGAGWEGRESAVQSFA